MHQIMMLYCFLQVAIMAVGEAGVAMVMVIADAITDGEATLVAIGVRIQYHIVLYPEKSYIYH